MIRDIYYQTDRGIVIAQIRLLPVTAAMEPLWSGAYQDEPEIVEVPVLDDDGEETGKVETIEIEHRLSPHWASNMPADVPVGTKEIAEAREERGPFTLDEALKTAGVKLATVEEFNKQNAAAEAEADKTIAEAAEKQAIAAADREREVRADLGDKTVDALLKLDGRMSAIPADKENNGRKDS